MADASYCKAKGTIHYLHTHGFSDLAVALYICLKKNPYPKGEQENIRWNEQVETNIPLLYLASLILYDFAEENGFRNFLFVTRDCVHWHKIFNTMFRGKGFHVTYFDSSRVMFQEAEKQPGGNKFYRKYFLDACNHDINHSVYVDVHGTGKHMISYCQKEFDALPACFLMTIGGKSYKDMPPECYQLAKKNRLRACSFDMAGSPIEMLNYDVIGTLMDYDEKGAVRLPPEKEYDVNLLKPYHKCVELFLRVHQKRPAYSVSTENLQQCIDFVSRSIKERKDQPSLKNDITHVRKHEADVRQFKLKQAADAPLEDSTKTTNNKTICVNTTRKKS
jgi:hypothetical protein